MKAINSDERGDAGAEPESRPDITRVEVKPGICGFGCVIEARRKAYRHVSIHIMDSACKQIQHLSKAIKDIGLRELFLPVTQNPVYVSAERAGCHPSCPIPMAVLKAVEVTMGMALARDVVIEFK
ncbi:MAG: hypothetical protein KJ573_08775 [Proteobacteria bacterium]|nr:hypothetical protein [Pseudomonadota bacterium]